MGIVTYQMGIFDNKLNFISKVRMYTVMTLRKNNFVFNTVNFYVATLQ